MYRARFSTLIDRLNAQREKFQQRVGVPVTYSAQQVPCGLYVTFEGNGESSGELYDPVVLGCGTTTNLERQVSAYLHRKRIPLKEPEHA